MQFSLNIGLNVGDTLTHSERAVHEALAIAFPQARIIRSHIRRSIFNELTCCCVLVCPETKITSLPGRLDFLCTLLHQEAIAAKGNGQRFLCGPGAHKWNDGAFNEDAWLTAVPENNPHADGQAVLVTLSDSEHAGAGYVIGFHPFSANGEINGWFERTGDGTGGGLWLEIGPTSTLDLLDYDGTPCLPAAVLTVLRQAGINAGREFE